MMDNETIAEMEKRFADGFGCPAGLRDLSYAPWTLQLMADAKRLLAEVKRLREHAP